MNFDLEKTVKQIENNSNFRKLKNVIENNPYHDHESTYDHLLKTLRIAQKEIKGEYVNNTEAKTAFESYISVHIDGILKRDLMLIFALIHDIGKIIVFEENGRKIPMEIENADGTTTAKGHEYWGSLIVPEITKELDLSQGVIDYLSKCVRLHGTFSNVWNENKEASAIKILPYLKRASEGIQVELIFNGYCDCFTAKPFQPAIPLIHELLNLPETYEEVKYSI